MYAYNVPIDTLTKIADRLGLYIDADIEQAPATMGKRVRFTLRWDSTAYPDDPTRYRHTSPSWHGKNRKTNKACFHAHYDFLWEVFEAEPKTVLESSYYGRVRYTAENFKKKAQEYGLTQVGPQIFPVSLMNCCECGTDSYGIVH